MSAAQFTIGENRSRPPYKIRTIRCSNCEGPISMYSEQSQLVVCEYCGEQLDCSREELVALGKQDTDGAPVFRFQLHQECQWEGLTYKVIARIRSTDRWDALITDYLLFHPFQGTRWLSIYDSEEELDFSMSQSDHVLSRLAPFSLSEGDVMATENSEKWRYVEKNTIRIQHVDGALPWIAKQGDVHEEIEFSNLVRSAMSLSVEMSSGGENSAELEYSVFKTVSEHSIYKAFGVEPSADVQPRAKSKGLSRWVRWPMLVFLLFCAFYFLIATFASEKREVATFHFSAEEVSTEILSPTFEILPEDLNQAVEIEYIAGVDNSWLSLNIGIVSASVAASENQFYSTVLASEEDVPAEQQTQLRHLTDVDISYYHGYEGGESWSEGSRSDSMLLMFPESGLYRILLTGVSGFDDTALSQNAIPLSIVVYRNAHTGRYFGLMGLFCLFSLMVFWGEE